jgi:hypothetical protein
VACRWFSPGTPVSTINKTYHHDINEILLKVALNTIKQNKVLHDQIIALIAWYPWVILDVNISMQLVAMSSLRFMMSTPTSGEL